MSMRLRTFCFGMVAAGLLFPALAAENPTASDAASPATGKSYQIRNKKYGELLRPEEANGADGTPIVLYPAQSWKCMTWKLTSAGAAEFSLQNHFTSKTFAAKTGGDQSAAAVAQVPFGRNPAERPVWQFSKLKDGSYKIVDSKTGKALSAQKSSNGGSNAKIVLEAWTESDAQKWELVEIDPAKLTM